MELYIYFVSACCLTCATLVICVNNPIHSILLLILVFFFGNILLLILNLEFFALIFLIVYVGAIAVLFLFMVMTLDIKTANVTQKFRDVFSHRSIIVAFILLHLLLFLDDETIFLFSSYDNISDLNAYLDYSKILKPDNHLEVLGKALFKEYTFPFLLCGFILFIAMIGAIVVTVEDRKYKIIKQQDPLNQAYRTSANTIFNFKSYPKKPKKFY